MICFSPGPPGVSPGFPSPLSPGWPLLSALRVGICGPARIYTQTHTRTLRNKSALENKPMSI
jgi:hypothetical protein